MKQKAKTTYLILHNIRSTHNVGAIFRTADAAGISKIYLTGYTPAPVDRFGRARKDIVKAALGAEKNVDWEQVTRINSLFGRLKKEEVFLVAVEQNKRAIDYIKVKSQAKTAFIFGNEVTGLSPAILKEVDVIAEIPMKGKKESLNVSVAVGVALFRML